MYERPIILFSTPADPSGEYAREKLIAQDHFLVSTSRMRIPEYALVIGRYSVLPMYQQLVEDLDCIGAQLVNTYGQHRYIANLENWYADLFEDTFPTVFSLEDLPDNTGPVVVKGETNSRKDRWNTHMYAKNKQEAVEVFIKLQADACLGEQRMCFRQYVPLVRLTDEKYGPPVTLEYRFFCFKDKILSSGYYWSSSIDDVKHLLPKQTPQGAIDLVNKVLQTTKDNCNFVVVDVALTESGRWMVVELNDGQMSGLSENDPKVLYANLAREALSFIEGD